MRSKSRFSFSGMRPLRSASTAQVIDRAEREAEAGAEFYYAQTRAKRHLDFPKVG
jgi:hypothetical protein